MEVQSAGGLHEFELHEYENPQIVEFFTPINTFYFSQNKDRVR